MEEVPQPTIDLKDKINETLAGLGVSARWKKAPQNLGGAEVLKDKTIVMVDDVVGVLEAFVPNLTVATEGKASFLVYDGQSVEELADQILAGHPNLVLMDYHLSDTLKGSSVIKKLKELGYNGMSVGFSSDNDTARDFADAGAMASVRKEGGYPEMSVQELIEKVK